MKPIEFMKLMKWITEEFANHQSIFGISDFFSEKICETALGPAAGPHTQLAQNIVAGYLCGGRFFELKTVQKIDNLEIQKPCIDTEDEAYNTEWSSEFTVPDAYDEYLKAWVILHFLQKKLYNTPPKFIFNMSVGYDLEGIKTQKIDSFIENLKNASSNKLFKKYVTIVREEFLKDFDISPIISDTVTLSTMHGCPPDEIEKICSYLLTEKKINCFVKLNPTLLGFDFVTKTLKDLGYNHITLDPNSFDNDLKFDAAVSMIKRLKELAKTSGKTFGVKLSNTLGVKNNRGLLPGDEMYMSGKSLFPLTINLASKLAEMFEGNINISYSGGAYAFNISEIIATGIKPITIATDLLKPGGYNRLKQCAELVHAIPKDLNLEKLDSLAKRSLIDKKYAKKEFTTSKIDKKLPLFDCYIAPCVEACPINQNVPEYLRLIAEKRFDEAFELITSKNPLPHITGFICNHQCMLNCTRNEYESPLLIRELKKVAAIEAYNSSKKPNLSSKKNNIKTAIIGAGPSGLSAAYFLARAGFDVTVFDKREKPGGVVQYVIPRFRIPQWAIDNDIELVKNQGVKFQLGKNENFSISKLKEEGFKYIHLAIGAGNSRELSLEKNDSEILTSIKFLEKFNESIESILSILSIKSTKNIAIIGGGNSAMDSARAAKKIPGVENVYIIYRRTIHEMPADREELDAALEDGIIFKELLLPVEFQNFKLKCQIMKLGEPDASGRKRPEPVKDKFETIEIETVISAIGEFVEKEILEKNKIILKDSVETSVENVFIGGDALRGPSTVIESIADGRKAAFRIIEKEFLKLPIEPKFSFDNISWEKNIQKAKTKLQNQSEKDFQTEAQRCLACNYICNKCVEVCPNRANVAVKLSASFKNSHQIIHLDSLCNECGNCATFCPYNGAPYKDKLTLFKTKEDFENSVNDGFYFKKEGYEIRLKSGEIENVKKVIDKMMGNSEILT